MSEIQGPLHLDPGDVVDGWRVVRELGAGGMGRVLLVERGGERLAMKMTARPYTAGKYGRWVLVRALPKESGPAARQRVELVTG